MRLKKIIYATLKAIIILVTIFIIIATVLLTQLLWGWPFGGGNPVDPADIPPPRPTNLPLGAPCEPFVYGEVINETENGVPLDTQMYVMEVDYWDHRFPMRVPLGYIDRGFPGISREAEPSILLGAGTSFRVHMPDKAYDYSSHHNYLPPDFCKDGMIEEDIQQYVFEFEIERPVPEGEALDSKERGYFGTLDRFRDTTIYDTPEDYPYDWIPYLGLSGHYNKSLGWYVFEEAPGSPYLVTGWCHPFGTCGVLAEFSDRDYAVRVYAPDKAFHLWPEMLETAMLFIEDWRVDPEKPPREETIAEIRAIIEKIYYE